MIVLLVLCMAGSLSANNWPHWRGPSATGVAAPSALPATWSVKENLAWHAPLEGVGVSSPIVWGERVYVTSQAGDGRRQSGRHPTLAQGVDPATAGERVGGVFTASPIAGDGKIDFVSESGETVMLRAGRAFEILSRNKLDGHFVASPAAAAGQVFLRADDRMFAVGSR